jgi:ferredoxin
MSLRFLISSVVYYFAAGGNTLKIRINKAMCVGNARCAAVAPDLFPLDDDGYISVEEIDVPAGMEDLARRGAKACPERIIVIEE